MNKSKPKVLFIWDVEKNLRKHLSSALSGIAELNFAKGKSEASLNEQYDSANVIVGWRPDEKLIRNSGKLKLFINPGTGIRHLIELFREINKERRVKLVNGHGHSYATAQHTVSMLLSLMNRIVPHHNWMQQGVWRTSDDKDIFSASAILKNRKIGLLGYGAINSKVHRFLSGFDNEFNICKRRLSEKSERETADQAGNIVRLFRINELNKFLRSSDILIIAVPHTKKTEDLIGMNELKLLGKDGLLVNVARGSIVNEKDLYNALKKGVIAGAAIDVWYNYNPAKDKEGREFPYKHPFHKLGNVLLSPHRAASPFDDLDRWDEVIENIKRVAQGKRNFLNEVNLDEEY